MNTQTELVSPSPSSIAAPARRGRKPLNVNFAFPDGEFTVRELATKFGVSVPYVSLRIKASSDTVKLVRTEKNPGGRGKPRGIWQKSAIASNE